VDVFERVQETKPDLDGVESRVDAARARLMTEIAADTSPTIVRSARPRWVLAGSLVGATAAVVVGILVVTGITARTTPAIEAVPTREPGQTLQSPEPEIPTPAPTQAPMTSAQAFGAAATAARTFTGLTLAPGQYLRRQEQSEQVVYHQPDPEGGQYQTDRSNAQNAWRGTSSWSSYAPADLSEQWLYTTDQSWTVTDTFGPDAAALAQARQESMSSSGAPYFSDGPAAPWGTPEGYGLGVFFAAMPTDPAGLIEWIRENQGASTGDQDYKVGWVLIDLLSYNLGSSTQRATMYEALSMLPGSEIVSTDGDLATLRFSAATEALSGEAAIQRRSVTIDTTTGIVHEKTATLDTASALIPATMADERYVYTVSVVDSLP
jgi:hypothetical protein